MEFKKKKSKFLAPKEMDLLSLLERKSCTHEAVSARLAAQQVTCQLVLVRPLLTATMVTIWAGGMDSAFPGSLVDAHLAMFQHDSTPREAESWNPSNWEDVLVLVFGCVGCWWLSHYLTNNCCPFSLAITSFVCYGLFS